MQDENYSRIDSSLQSLVVLLVAGLMACLNSQETTHCQDLQSSISEFNFVRHQCQFTVHFTHQEFEASLFSTCNSVHGSENSGDCYHSNNKIHTDYQEIQLMRAPDKTQEESNFTESTMNPICEKQIKGCEIIHQPSKPEAVTSRHLKSLKLLCCCKVEAELETLFP